MMIFQILALLVLLSFYGCYYAKMISQRKKGIQTDQLGKGKVGFVKFIEVTMKIVTIIVPIAEVISIILNTGNMPVLSKIVGAFIGFIGVAVFAASVITMKDSWRAGVSETDKTELVTTGIYKISRNPAFLGFDLVYIGVLFMFFNWALFTVSAIAALMFHLQILNVEEDYLMKAFGDDYLKYRKKVCRYLGHKLGK